MRAEALVIVRFFVQFGARVARDEIRAQVADITRESSHFAAHPAKDAMGGVARGG
jgi:hypothetical protein